MRMQAWQKRVVAEKKDLDAKLAKLNAFLGSSDKSKDLTDAEHNRLARQAGIMEQYSYVLSERIEAWKE
jgi:hypothetical protein